MKVEVLATRIVFGPIRIELEIETEDELDELWCRLNAAPGTIRPVHATTRFWNKWWMQKTTKGKNLSRFWHVINGLVDKTRNYGGE